ncbi:MAG: hypothetical protein CME70_08895 [Halobacteriovorax sp.]|nr:hypothetical protein [Halobacteriovorax sp.]|tara:strand:+ start:66641 stop:67885 length:1245 start_codon:yes stop_codon:yes gene_type:complete
MSKTVLIKRGSKSNWVSCQSITNNIEEAYSLVLGKDQSIVKFLNNEDDQYEQWKLAKEISSLNPKTIIFLDHQPHPESFLLSLDACMDKLPHLIFHVFGDFTLQTNNWIGIEGILKKTSSKIIVASKKQKALLENLINANKEYISVLPFPIDTKFFNYSPAKTNDKVTYLYSGRLSTQKNILELITYFDQFNKNIANNSKLIIAGPFDDLGIPFLGKNLSSGSYGHSVEKKLASLNNENIEVLRNCNHEELLELYRSSDFYISLSTHNDEDYGMAPAEALCCGLPCILSDWGGFSGFKELSQNRYVPIQEKNGRILPLADKLILELTSANEALLSVEERKKLSLESIDILGIEAYANSLKSLIKQEPKILFDSFTREMEMMASSHRINKEAPFFKGSNGSYSSLYKKIYEPYFN